jgi:hypothetical protein
MELNMVVDSVFPYAIGARPVAPLAAAAALHRQRLPHNAR